MRRRLVLVFSLFAAACTRSPAASEVRAATQSPRSEALARGAFRITETKSPGTGGTWYLARGSGACAFEVVIGTPKSGPGGLFSMAPATISRHQGADCSSFLHDLALELGFTGKIPAPPPVAQLSAAVVILGTNQSRSPDGSTTAGAFLSKPPGHCTLMKLFLADGEGEVFLNLNAQDGVGEFSMKDEEYGEVVVGELAKVLLPSAG